MIRIQLLSVGEVHTDHPIAIKPDLLDPGTQSQRPPVLLQAPHQGVHNTGASTLGEVKTGLGVKPLPEQGGHGRGIGIGHRHPADQKAEKVNPVPQEGVRQVTVHKRTESTTEMPKSRKMRQQTAAASEKGADSIDPTRWKRQKGKSISRRCDRLQRSGETPPFLQGCLTAKLLHHLLKTISADADPEVAFREENVPVPVGHHLDRFIESPKNLSERIVAGPPAQSTPERWTGFEVIALALKAMGSTTGCPMGLEHEHLMASTGTEGCTTQTADTAANHDHLGFGGHGEVHRGQ